MVRVYGYGRPTAAQPDSADHARALTDAGAETVFLERRSAQARGSLRERRRLLAQIAPGDVLILQGLDRLGGNFDDMLRCFELLIDRGVEVRVLDADFQSVGAAAETLRQLLKLLAMARASLNSDKIRLDLASARARGGKRPGSRSTLTPEQWPDIAKRLETGTRESVATELGVHRQTLWAFRRRMLDLEAQHATKSAPGGNKSIRR